MEKLDKERYLKRVIIVCWIALAIFFGIKLFGGNLFEIACQNATFIKVCQYAEEHLWLYYPINYLYCMSFMYFHVLAMIKQWKYEKWQLFAVATTIFVGIFVKIISPIFSFIYDVFQGILMPYIISKRRNKRIIQIVLGNILLIIFQLMSLFIRNISIGIITNNSLIIGIIYGIDVFIMVVLYYFYSNISKERR